MLWLQERVRNGEIELRKVKGELSPADLFTKFIGSRDKILQLWELFGCECRGGRAEPAPWLRKKMDDEDWHVHTFEGTVVNDEDDYVGTQP